jgi:hypothetical protein
MWPCKHVSIYLSTTERIPARAGFIFGFNKMKNKKTSESAQSVLSDAMTFGDVVGG